ncbi:MAG: hypothetical protein KJ767_00370 [Nanoarchaeota archaeon]|nr:hypothetical protein [Nanoarchaeota archaeon]
MAEEKEENYRVQEWYNSIDYAGSNVFNPPSPVRLLKVLRKIADSKEYENLEEKVENE